MLTNLHTGGDGVAGLQNGNTILSVQMDNTFEIVTDLAHAVTVATIARFELASTGRPIAAP